MLRRCLAALAVLVSILRSEPVLAQGIMLEGSIDCGLWMQARTESRAEALEHYLIGFLNGLALAARIDFWRAGPRLSRQQIYLWMDNYCRSTPLSSPVQGAIALINERTGGAWDRRRDD